MPPRLDLGIGDDESEDEADGDGNVDESSDSGNTDDDESEGGGICGNGKLEHGERCDDAALDGHDCQSLGFEGGTLRCNHACEFDVEGCHRCGDGALGGDELCDVDQLGGETCESQGFDGGELRCALGCREFDTSNCTDEDPCGNGVIDPGEDCDGGDLDGQGCPDHGFDGGTLRCAETCRFDIEGCFDRPCGQALQACNAGNPCCEGLSCFLGICI